MRHIEIRRNYLTDTRKVPLSTIILPPLSPPLPENELELVGKVMVSSEIL